MLPTGQATPIVGAGLIALVKCLIVYYITFLHLYICNETVYIFNVQ